MRLPLIIPRYLSKEIAGTLFGVTFVFLLLFLSNWLVKYLSYAASGKLAANILLQLMGFEIPYLLAILLPLGLYLGIILAYGRLYADSEMRVLHACGLSVTRLIKMTGWVTLAVTAVVLVLMLWINPWIATVKEKVLARSAGSDNVLSTLMPGRFQVSGDGRRVIYVEKIARNRKHAENLFIAQHLSTEDENANWVVISAAQGSQVRDPETHDRFIVADQGYRYEGMPGQNEYKIIQFQKYSVLMPEIVSTSTRQEQESISTFSLLKNYENPQHAAEFQWRVSIIISTCLLALLAVPLSYVRPRYGKYSQLFPAILIYIAYVNLLLVARNWIEVKIVPISVGMWWVHLLIVFLAICLIWPSLNLSRRTA